MFGSLAGQPTRLRREKTQSLGGVSVGFWVGFGVVSVLLGGIGTIGEYWALRLPTGEYSALLGPSGGVFGTIGAYWGMFGTTGADSEVFGVTGAFWGGGIRRYWGL